MLHCPYRDLLDYRITLMLHCPYRDLLDYRITLMLGALNQGNP